MKRILPLLIVCFLVIGFNQRAEAQSLKDLPFKERLWYGGGFVLGFSGGNGFSALQLGLSPMVAYKFTPRFSVGPRVSTLISFYWADTFNGDRASAQPVNLGIGLFSRYKITSEIFAHVEYEYADQAFIQRNFDDLTVTRITNDNIYIGAGYSSGQGASRFEILGLYNVNQNIQTFESPFSLRFGFTRNF